MKVINNLKIGIRLLIVFSIIGLLTLIGIIQNNNKSKQIEVELNEVYKEQLESWYLLIETERLLYNANRAAHEAIMARNSENTNKLHEAIAVSNQNINLAQAKFNKFKKFVNAREANIYENLEAIGLNFKKFLEVNSDLASMITSNDTGDYLEKYTTEIYNPVFENLQTSLNKFSGDNLEIIKKEYNTTKNILSSLQSNSFLILFFILLVLSIAGFLLERSIRVPLQQVVRYIKKMSTGQLPENFEYLHQDEIGQIKMVLNEYVNGLRKTANFANEIGKGHLDMDYKPLSDKDILGNSLLEMREGLKEASEEEKKRKEEDEKRNWATQGLAKFSDILRKDNDNVDKLSNEVLSNLINYVNANQGGLFLLNEDDEDKAYLELVASYAYNKKKYTKKKILLGEGMVGTCALEKETIHLKEIPDEYVEITSGLGDSTPKSILIVPLKIEDKIFGIIELASFYFFEKHQIEFVEKLGESIASTISGVKINAKTAALLEESKQQAEEMATKEEEMRQNLEELQATQEEMERLKKRETDKSKDLVERMESQRKMLIKILDQVSEKVFLKDKNGKMLLVNNAVAKVHHTTPEGLIGQSDFDFFDQETAQLLFAEEEEIKKEGGRTWEQTEELSGQLRYLKTTKTPFYIPHLDQTGLLGVQSDITEYKNLQEKEKTLQKENARLKAEIENLKKANEA